MLLNVLYQTQQKVTFSQILFPLSSKLVLMLNNEVVTDVCNILLTFWKTNVKDTTEQGSSLDVPSKMNHFFDD